MKPHLGIAMIAAPFVALAIFSVATVGVGETIAIFTGSAALFVWIGVAIYLIAENK